MVDDIDTILRDYVVPGVPGSGDYEIEKPKLRKLLKAIVATVNGGTGVVVPTYRGAWSGATTYNEGDAVEYGGSLWIADQTNTNVTPVDGADWSLFLTGGSVSDGSITDIKVASPSNPALGIGAGKLRYTPTLSSGYTHRSVADRLQERISIKDFGAIGDSNSRPLSSVTSFRNINTTGYTLVQWQAIFPHATALTDELNWCAIQAAVNFAGTFFHGALVFVPRGFYFVNKQIDVPFDYVGFDGDGLLTSVIFRTDTSYGHTVNFSKAGNAVIRGSRFTNIGLEFRGTQMVTHSHLRLRSVVDGYFANFNLESGYIGMLMLGCGMTDVIAGRVRHQYGNGGQASLMILASDVTANPIATDVHFYGFELQPLRSDFPYDYGLVVAAGDGIYFTNCHWNYASTALYINQGGTQNLSGLLFTACWFDNCEVRSVLVDGSTSAHRFNYEFLGCVFRGNAAGQVASLVELAGDTSFVNFTACEFRWSRRTCLNIGVNASFVSVSAGCKFIENNLDGDGNSAPIALYGDNATINGNTFFGVANAGAGISVVAGAVNYVITSNNLAGLINLSSGNRLIDAGGAVSKVVASNLV